MEQQKTAFEQGPIRPPNEAHSLLLRFTRNCPWNRCQFCPVYKHKKFAPRKVHEIQEDIHSARLMADEILALSRRLGAGGAVTEKVMSEVFSQTRFGESFRSVAVWLYFGTGACFLQDADNLVLKTEHLVEALETLRATFPEITRVTTYARSRTLVTKSAADLVRIREAGLDRIHIGLETGHDPLLELVEKGVTAAQHIEAGLKVREAGLELSEYIMPGLGGRKMWREHAIDTARVLNAIDPHFIRLRSLRVPRRVPLYKKIADGSFSMQSDDKIAAEILLLIDHLNGITSHVTSDHFMNLLEDLTGTLPEDKDKMRRVIVDYQNLCDEDRVIYRVGRRGGAFSSVDDLRRDPATYRKIEEVVSGLRARGGDEAVEIFITELVDRYI